MKYKNNPTWHKTYLFVGEILKEEIKANALDEYLLKMSEANESDAQKIVYEYIENELPEYKNKILFFKNFR